jgi:flagellar basal-body rod modification protein FlgD
MSMISFVPAAPAAAQTADAGAALSGNFDTFLHILTAQIQNQDPLQPTDSAQFTQQLVQFSGVEQQIKANTSLSALLAANRTTTGASLAGYLGQTAEINGNGADYEGQTVKWNFNLPSTAAKSTVTVSDAKGKIVFSADAPTAEGDHGFDWNGDVFGGGKAPKGAYYVNVVAEDANAATIKPTYSILATVTGVDLTHGDPALTTSAGVFAYSDVKRLTKQ